MNPYIPHICNQKPRAFAGGASKTRSAARDKSTLPSAILKPGKKTSKKERLLRQRICQSPKVKKFLYRLDARRVFSLDVEMTGLGADDEILQVSVVDATNAVRYNQYFRPERKTCWDETVPIHHITPEKVKNAPSFYSLLPQLNSLFSDTQLLIGYNTMQDVRFLQRHGVRFSPFLRFLDMGEAYSFIHSAHQQLRSYAKLQDCAAHYAYGGQCWHDSLADAKATMYCFYAMMDDKDAIFRFMPFTPSAPPRRT